MSNVFSTVEVARRAEQIVADLLERLVEKTGIPWIQNLSSNGFTLTAKGVPEVQWSARIEVKEQQVTYGWSTRKGNGALFVVIGAGTYKSYPLMRRDKIKGGVDYDAIVDRAALAIAKELESQRAFDSRQSSRGKARLALDKYLAEIDGFKQSKKSSGPALWYESGDESWSIAPLANDGIPKILLTASVPTERMGELLELLVGEGFLASS